VAASKWSQDVTEHSNALDLERDVFTRDDPKSIALSLKRSAEHSKRRKGVAFPVGDVDADLLYQPRGQRPAGDAEKSAGKGKRRAPRRVRALTSNRRKRIVDFPEHYKT
jgi:hypothetical protein